MKTLYFDFYDKSRKRQIPVAVYLPKNFNGQLPTVIFGSGYQGRESILKEKLVYRRYNYLAEYFSSNGYAFISIQHDISGDDDGSEKIDPKAIQDEARRHLYLRGEANILFTIESLKQLNLPLYLDKSIFAGHSNGGDIAKYFIRCNQLFVSSLILFDARRTKLKPTLPLSVLMFEANDTTTDAGVIADSVEENNTIRSNLDLIVIKPSEALHTSYMDDYITETLKKKIFITLDWFLKNQISS